jgi:SAM-dependent methyltransferase
MIVTTLEDQIEKIRGFERGYRATQVLNQGASLFLMQHLSAAGEGMTPSDLSRSLMLYEPFVRIWCQTAYHFEILDCDESGRFSLQPFLAQVLGLPSGLDGLLDIAPPFLLDEGREGDQGLMNYFRTGQPVNAGRTAAESQATQEATRGVPVIFFSMILPRYPALEQLLKTGVRFLDIGCGSGYFIIELAGAFANSEFVGIDPDIHGITRAEEAVMQFGLDQRIIIEDMAAEEVEHEDEFGMISMVATLHEVPPHVRKEAVQRVYRALRNNGFLLILDFPYPGRIEDFRNPRYNFGIIEQYFEAPQGVAHLSAEQQDELLADSGFSDIQRMDVGQGTFDFILARK